jgi:hypothetical protein
MFRQDWFGSVVLALVVALLLGQILPASAQDAVDTMDDMPAATENIMESSATLGMEEEPLASTDSQANVQEQATLAEGEAGQSVEAQYRIFLPAILSDVSAEAGNEVSAAYVSLWNTIKYETFDFTISGWKAFDCNGGWDGEYYWGADDYKPHAGLRSIWVATSGINGLDPETSSYPARACSWMVYGPFSLEHAKLARMTFKYWNQSELNHDFFQWLVSCNGIDFYGKTASGDSAGWKTGTLDLGDVQDLGGCLGDTSVWIAFKFTSDASRPYQKGTFVDDVVIEGYYQY